MILLNRSKTPCITADPSTSPKIPNSKDDNSIYSFRVYSSRWQHRTFWPGRLSKENGHWPSICTWPTVSHFCISISSTKPEVVCLSYPLMFSWINRLAKTSLLWTTLQKSSERQKNVRATKSSMLSSLLYGDKCKAIYQQHLCLLERFHQFCFHIVHNIHALKSTKIMNTDVKAWVAVYLHDIVDIWWKCLAFPARKSGLNPPSIIF